MFMKKWFKFCIFLFAVVSLVAMPFSVSAQMPFGGPIVWYFPACHQGTWLMTGPPVPMSLMYTYGSISFANGRPSHYGQFLLGMAGGFMVCTITCAVGTCPIGGGMIILYHGSSV